MLMEPQPPPVAPMFVQTWSSCAQPCAAEQLEAQLAEAWRRGEPLQLGQLYLLDARAVMLPVSIGAPRVEATPDGGAVLAYPVLGAGGAQWALLTHPQVDVGEPVDAGPIRDDGSLETSS